MANVLYSCSVALADANGTAFYYDYAYITFKTRKFLEIMQHEFIKIDIFSRTI